MDAGAPMAAADPVVAGAAGPAGTVGAGTRDFTVDGAAEGAAEGPVEGTVSTEGTTSSGSVSVRSAAAALAMAGAFLAL